MSADNAFYVKKVKRKWYVWYAFISDENYKPSKNAKVFTSRAKALCAAHDLEKENGTEYGVIEL